MAEKINEILNPIKFNSEVHVINDHSIEIDGGLVVHGKAGLDLLVVQSADSGNIESKCINNLVYEVACSNEPYIDLDGTTSWNNDSSLSVPYWITFPIAQGYSYRLQYDPTYSMGEMSLLTPETAAGYSCGYHLVLSATHEGDTLNKVSYTYTPSNSDGEWGYKGTLEFTADISGYAYIAMNNGTNFGFGVLDPEAAENNRWRVYETSAQMSGVKINGDLIADYAKVKNAPVEDDDVVNLKTLKEWVPSTTKKEYLTVTRGDYSKTLENVSYADTYSSFYDPNATYSSGYTLLDPETTYYIDLECMGELVTGELTTTIGESQSISKFEFIAHNGQSYDFPYFITLQPASSYDGQLDCYVQFPEVSAFSGNISIYKKIAASGGADISDYQGNAKINGNLEVTGNLSFDGDLEMSSIEAQSIKINGKRVLTEDDLVNLVAYPAAEDYTF